VRSPDPDLRRTLGRGDWVRLAYRLGREAASGVLTLTARSASAPHTGEALPSRRTGPDRPGSDVLVLRRGAVVCAEGELARRSVVTRLARAAAEPSLTATFDGSVTAYPPGALHQVALAAWARSHLEAQLDGALAESVLRELAGLRLGLRPELAPAPLDDADRRMLAAMAQPRRLDEIWPLARTPRFRLLAFLHFLRAVGALVLERVAARSAAVRPADPRRDAALRLLGVDDTADPDTVKRAYRRLARALHPDLQPGADAPRRRMLERRFAEVTAAYEALV
jgi:DnaJ-domain-containing protein 1